MKRGSETILLVDTNVTFRDELTAALARFEIGLAWRARVLGLFATIAKTDALAVVLGADLPGSDPVDLLRKIRERRLRAALPVYVVADDPSREFVLQAYVAGADAVIARDQAASEIAARVLHRARTRRTDRTHTARDAADRAIALCEPGDATTAEAPGHEIENGRPSPLGNGSGGVPIGVSPPVRRPDREAEGPDYDDRVPAHVPDVIVVEDDPSLLEMLRYALSNRGYRTLSFSNGLDALRAMREMDTGGHRPVVLLDVDLPGIDGFRVLHELSGTRPGDFQILLCTVHNSEATQVLGLQSGALDYLVKPLRMPVVLAKVERLLERKRVGGTSRV